MPRSQQDNARNGQTHVRTRAFASGPSTLSEDGRSFDIIIFTENPVRTEIRDPRVTPVPGQCVPWIEVDEVLRVSGLDLSQSPRMPLVNNHSRHGDIRQEQLGSVRNIRIEQLPVGPAVVGRATLAHLHADLAPDVAEGNLGNISAGFYADEYEMVERPGDVPLAIAHRTVLLEASFVPVGADPNCSVRGDGSRTFPAPRLRSRNTETEKPKMELKDAIEAAEAALAVVDEAVKEAGDGADKELIERARKLREVAAPVEDDKDKDAAAASEGARADEAAATATEDEKKEEAEVRSIRSAAVNLGKDLVEKVDGMKALGMRAADIRAAISKTVATRGLADAPAQATKPAPAQRSAPEINYRSIYDRLNGRA